MDWHNSFCVASIKESVINRRQFEDRCELSKVV